MFKDFCGSTCISLDYSPAYGSESNKAAGRLIEEHLKLASALLFTSQLSGNLRRETIAHGNWLRKRIPARRVEGRIPILMWDQSIHIDFKSLHEFLHPQKNLLPEAEFGHFAEKESDVNLPRIYVPHSKPIMFTRAAHFKQCNEERLLGVSALLNGLALQSEFEAESQDKEGTA